MERGSSSMLRRVVIAERRMKGARIIETNQLPATLVAVAAPLRTREEAHDDVPAQRFEELGVFDRGSRFALRCRDTLVIKRPLIRIESGESAVDEVNDARFFGARSQLV